MQTKLFLANLKMLMYNINMRKGRRINLGFTLIEVTLVLAITTALAAAILGSISANIRHQRFVDSYTDFANFLRGAYSSTINVQNPRLNTEESSLYCTMNSMWDENGRTVVDNGTDNFPGRTRCAIYGKLITFGEENPKTSQRETIVHMYDIIGRVYTGQAKLEDSIGDNALSSLKSVAANIITVRDSTKPSCDVDYAGQHTSYTPQWQARLEYPKSHDLLRGAVMIIRSPVSGTIHTYFYDQPDQTFDVNKFIAEMNHDNANTGSCDKTGISTYRPHAASAMLYGALGDFVPAQNSSHQFELANSKMRNDRDYIICLASDDIPLTPKRRRPIRIKADGSNSSAIELINIDGTENPCD